MRRACAVALFALLAGSVGCGKKSSGSGAGCGAAGQACCGATSCASGLVCQAGTCQASGAACGTRDQACCATGTACFGTLVCEVGTCKSPQPAIVTKTVCASGGTIAIAGATLTIPSGALAGCRPVRLSTTTDPAPVGYTPYSPMVVVEPDGLDLAKPASLSIDVSGAPEATSVFWSQPTTGDYEPMPGTVAGGVATAQISRFGRGFVAGRDFVLICAAGGTVTIPGATLTIPPGALSSCTRVKLERIAVAPERYTTYSPVFQVEPAGTELATPATIAIDLTATPEAWSVFWSRNGAPGFEPEPGTLTGGTAVAQIPRFGQGFVAGRDYVLTCAAGGTLIVPGATLTLPKGALASCTMVKLSAAAETPQVYTPYSPILHVEPDDAVLAKPASMTVAYSGDLNLATWFWSRRGTTGFERTSFTSASGSLTGEVPRFGRGFVADGVTFVDPPDRSCVVGKMVEGRTMDPSTVALFFTVDDCWGRPLAGLTGTDFTVLENGAAISPAESSATILPRTGVEVFTSLVIDLSASTLPQLPAVIASAKDFVTNLQVTKHLPVQIDIQLFAGDDVLTQWQAPTLDTATLLARLDALASYGPADRASTNLNGAVVTALSRVAAAEQAFRTRNFGGAFTIGYVVIFTDGRDTAARVTHADAMKAVQDSPDQIVAIGLDSAEYDAASLDALARNGVITAPDVGRLSTAFATVANRMEGQISRFYLLGYCSPKRAGAQNTVSVSVVGSRNQASASYGFSAVTFAPGCTAATFATGCDGRQCGGLGCGACDDREATCSQASSLCVNNCLAQGLCAGGTITNPQGYQQSCAATPTNTSCGVACVDTTTDANACGGCGIVCAAGQRCASGVCVP